MLKTRTRKILRDLLARKARTVLVSISIMIGVFGVVTLVSSGDILIRQLKEDIKQEELPMLRVYLSLPEGAMINNAAYLDMLRNLPEVQRVEGQSVFPLSWRAKDEERFKDDFIYSYSEPFEAIQLEPMRLIEGKWPDDGTKQIAIERRFADKNEFAVGDTMVVRALSQANVPEEEWEIVGIVFHPYTYFYAGQQINPNRAVYTTFSNAQYIAGFEGFGSIFARYADYDIALDQTTTFESAIREQTPYIPIFNYKEDPAENSFIRGSQQFTSLINILAIIAVVVSGFLVTNVISSIVNEQRRQIGVMKSLGASRWDSVWMYSGIAITYGVIGLIPGVLLGIPAGYRMAKFIAIFVNAYIAEFTLSPTGIILGVIMGLAVPVFASIIPVFLGTRVTILEAITDLGISARYGNGPIARLIKRVPIPINVRQALANVSMKKTRLALTGITLTLAVGAFMGVSAVFLALNDTLQGIFEAFEYEVQMQPNEGQDFESTRQLILDNIDAVEEVHPGFVLAVTAEDYFNVQFNSDQFFITGYDLDSSIFQLEISEGRLFANDENAQEIVISATIAEQLDKQVGDTIELTSAGKTETWEIVGIEGLLPFDSAYMNWRALAKYAGFSVDAFAPQNFITTTQVEAQTNIYTVGVVNEFWTAILAQVEYTSDAPAVVLTTDLAAKLNKLAGDTITLNDEATYTIAGIVPPQFELLQQFIDVPAELIEKPEAVVMLWRDLAALEGKNLEGEPAPNVFAIDLKGDDYTVKEVDNAIAEISELLTVNGITAGFQNQVGFAEQITQLILSAGVLLNLTSVVMAAVGAIGLLTTLSMSVFERQKEIGVMRSIGASSFTVATQFLVEGMLVGIFSWIVGIPLSMGIAYLLVNTLPGFDFNFSFPPEILVVGLIGVIFIATVASLWPSLGAARKTVSDILRYQ